MGHPRVLLVMGQGTARGAEKDPRAPWESRLGSQGWGVPDAGVR